MKTVAIVGVGLIGGSFGLALRRARFTGTILGVSSRKSIETAMQRGAVGRGVSLEEACASADLILLSTPVQRIIEQLPEALRLAKPTALVTDAGSTKRRIVETAEKSKAQAQFLGSHPMAGKEVRGVESADGELFEGRPWILTPRVASELETPAAMTFRGWLLRIGAREVTAAPEEHDRLVAAASHLPQMLSTTLAHALASMPSGEKALDISGPGLESMLRLAGGSWDIWRDIVATNSDEIAEAMRLCEEEMRTARQSLASGDVEEFFRRASEFAALLKKQSASGNDSR
jgi:prephenate dehydrogenase